MEFRRLLFRSSNDVFEDPQAKARGLTISMSHSQAGRLNLVASPLRMSATPPEYRTAPPLLGEHTNEVLGETLGLTALEIADLAAAGTIATR